ncbi:MAG: 1-acyl-sn-glycerol-3-phosphate acyltransferase [Bacteroidaceae bacterium]|nr:1-acyl-sn-glycerol-3-phosphate acyltransferase [Bacteroidaceae bacterium]
MQIPSEFDEIRPFMPEELPAAYAQLIADPQFRVAMSYVFPEMPFEELAEKMVTCKTGLDFEKMFCYPFLKDLPIKYGKGMDMDASAIDNQRRYTFVTNHRDIVLDSGLLSVLLLDSGFQTTLEIAIGDNLLSLPWVKTLVRVTKSFIVQRALTMRQMLESSARLSKYMHFAIGEKNENIWIAQREGRAKDSNDRTQASILKMMSMGGEGSVIDRLLQLHIVPLSISYEMDPCDFLKAKEFQQKRDSKDFKKSKEDDLISMRTGIFGYKGHIHYQCAPCIDEWLKTIDTKMPKSDLYDLIAAHIDREIHRNYRLYPVNYVSLDLLHGTTEYADRYSAEEKVQFEDYVTSQIAKIDLPNKDEAFLRERVLTMYANPAINYLATK